MIAVLPKIHWAFADDDTTTVCGLYPHRNLPVTDSRPDVTCKACLRHNPGSASKERAWHRVRRGDRTTDCGMQKEKTWWQTQALHKTYKDPEVTCGRCLRSMRVRKRAA